MDEKPEDDGGSVTLVNVELGEDGRTMTEVDHETGHWAWKREEGDDGTRSLKAAQSLSPKAAEVARKGARERDHLAGRAPDPCCRATCVSPT